MSTIKISQLPQLSATNAPDEFPIVSNGTTYKLPISVLDTRYLGNGGGINNNINSVAQLATIATIPLTIPNGILFINSVNMGYTALQSWQLISGTQSTSSTYQRPNDFNPITNPKVWYRVL